MYHNLITSILSICLTGLVLAQDFNHYKLVRSSGSIPDDFTTLSSDKVREDIEQIDGSQKRKSKKTQEEFYLESNFGIDEILADGSILFNDPITNYLNQIYRNIEKGNPSLKKENIRFYTSKSSIINAFTTHGGIIFFNVGLIAKLKTEDEIAYIMCHEIAHYINKHNIKGYVYNDSIDSKLGTFRRKSWEERMFSKSNYSQSHETEADILGFELLSNTSYSLQGAYNGLESLKSYKLPFESNHVLTKASLQNQYFMVDEKAITRLDNITQKQEDNDQKYSTHPDIQERLDTILTLITPGTTDNFIKNKLQKLAQFEICHLFLEKGENYHAIYCALALLNQEPNSKYLKEIIVKAIYAITQTRTYYSKYPQDSYYDELNYKDYQDYKKYLEYEPKEIQQISRFFDYYADPAVNRLGITSMWDYCVKNKLTPAMSQRLNSMIGEYHNYYENDSVQGIRPLMASSPTFSQIVEQQKNKPKPEKTKRKKAEHNSVDHLLILSPEYRKFNFTKKQSYRYTASEKLLLEYQEAIKKNTENLGMKSEILSNTNMQNSDIEMFNDIALLTSFFNEKDYATPNTICSKKEQILDLTKRYGTSKVSSLGIYSVHLKKGRTEKVTVLVFTTLFYPTLPFGIWYVLKPKYKTFNYTYMYDLVSEKVEFSNIHTFRMNGNTAVMNSAMYHDLLRIKKGKQ